ncbi:E3 ubiquitin-protein ligase upl7 [Phtheirospermum japonicum]|uniref:HECT-type E3 ubiquitin transferase n=1 Tax=Phtheirospermum japonicum TaxID=374723 RepID=A0A830BJ62_9LAMI|nr:E3 ubiquitin-protein ligase upl7 [Phtheirospermum japonicum]
MATGSIEEKTIWFHLSKRLIFVCSFVLSMFEYSHQTVQDVALTSTAMHLSVLLKDPKSWNSIADNNRNDANTAVKILVQFIGSKRSGLYSCIRKFISKFSSQELKSCQTDGIFLIVASAITLSLQPYHITNMDLNDDVMMECAVEQYCVSVLTIPWFPQRLPAILVPALRHKSVLLPCLRMLLELYWGTPGYHRKIMRLANQIKQRLEALDFRNTYTYASELGDFISNCSNDMMVMCQPTGGCARLSEGCCSFRRKGD